jgi:CRISPR/Cas system-associated exonuclease Cas4 (RecB family)
MTTWKLQLEKYNSLIELISQRKENGEEGLLRFGRCSVRASDVAGQYYCEKKVEMEYLFGEVETETKTQGTEGHENLLEGTEALDQEELWKAVYGKEPVLACEWLLLAEYNDVILAGQPDSVLFEDGYPLVIFEYKFSRSKRAYPSHHVQAGFYGLLLKSIGFDVKKLYYAIVVADRTARNDPNLRDNALEAIRKNGPQNAILPIENAVIYLNKFDEQTAKASLEWAIQFWKKQREATSTTNQNKCRICEYQEECKKLIF